MGVKLKLLLCVCVCVFCSAGSEWTEEAETYKSSFYKRSLDNDVYVVTSAPYANNGKYVFVIIIQQYPIFPFGLLDIFCPLFLSVTQDSVLVSRAMDLRVDEFSLKPAGKNPMF